MFAPLDPTIGSNSTGTRQELDRNSTAGKDQEAKKASRKKNRARFLTQTEWGATVPMTFPKAIPNLSTLEAHPRIP